MKDILFEIYEYFLAGFMAIIRIIKKVMIGLLVIIFVCMAFSGILLPPFAIFATEIMSTPLWVLLCFSIPCTICAIGMIVKNGG